MGAILEGRHALVFGAVRAAEHNTTGCLDPVADDTATTMGASRGQRVDSAFEAVERMCLPILQNLKRLVVFVATQFTYTPRLLLGSRF